MQRALLLGIACWLLSAGFDAGTASAQEGSLTAIEGHAFNAATLKPLAGVRVSLLVMEGDQGSSIEAITDNNGFYSLTFSPTPSVTSIDVRASCGNSRGIDLKQIPMYFPTRAIIYQRNVYLTPPRGRRCQ